MLLQDEQPVAGPSSRPYSPAIPSSSLRECAIGANCPFLFNTPTITQSRHGRLTSRPSNLDQVIGPQDKRGMKRQESGDSSTSSTSAYISESFSGSVSNDPATSTSSSSRPLFAGPAATSSSEYTYNTTLPYSSQFNTSSDASTYLATSTATSSYYRSTSFTSLWSYSASRSHSVSASQPSQTAYIPGVLLNLTLAGDSDTEAVYSVDVALGHSSSDSSSTRRDINRRRAASWNGYDLQSVKLQVDLGSSDLWVATTDCASTSCESANSLFNASQSLDSGVSANVQYQSGEVDGEIYWEEVTVGDFGIGYQAFIAASVVTDEDLKGGNFVGVLGLALPASSTILSTIGGTTGSNPDGATFLDNLFGAGIDAPSERVFALALERREDVRTSSSFGIGTVDQDFCPSPCEPPYIPIISQPQLGVTGYLHWRIPIQSISMTTWSDQQHGVGPTITNVTLGTSQVYPSKTTPLAVLDSGGVQILTGYRAYADAIYNAAGINMSADGLYRMPCTQQLAFTFYIAGQDVPVHPLDMTYPDPDDPSQAQCIGMIQYSSNLGQTGDFILGSSFLRNVYSIFQYPDTNKQKTWQPTVGLIPLTNASVASQDFYAVRIQRQSLTSVSSDQQAISSGTPSNPGSQPSQAATEKKVVNTTVIAAVSVVGFFVLAAVAFCAWWFWLRRKLGAGGVVEYKTAPARPRPAGYKSDSSLSSLRTKKHSSAQRQRSMVEGFSGTDYEADSWMSTTEGNDSIRLGYLPEVAEEDDDGRRTRIADKRSSRGSIIDMNGPDSYQLVDVTDPLSPRRSRTRSPPAPTRPGHDYTDAETGIPTSATSESIPLTNASFTQTSSTVVNSKGIRKSSMSMSGPFPAPTSISHMSGPFPSPATANNTAGSVSLPTARNPMRPDVSPMYDIRTSDYFSVPPINGRGREHRRGSSPMSDGRREMSGRRKSSPSKAPSGIDEKVSEEDGDEAEMQKELL
ncbi:uncharacterized protein IL334_000335 [Kwoniella shivajii]|uniref:Peptidase A1 domain-containing protein n=1 Tax=Kwoniella shivajii TaxID=564305 RepID=A0ABZ1CNV6_9TREE|nr:hypothetical protein IL334_000335 [Kwoniella shivajii]